jgi:hypothetical protein
VLLRRPFGSFSPFGPSSDQSKKMGTLLSNIVLVCSYAFYKKLAVLLKAHSIAAILATCHRLDNMEDYR